MNRTWMMVILLVPALAVFACANPETEQAETEAVPAAAEAAPGPDPVETDPDHYSAEFENDQVRVLRIAYGPGESSTMHYHPDSVAVFLTDQHVEMGMPDGTTETIDAKAGDALFMEGGQHLPKNVGESPFELVLVELKAGASVGEPGADPTVVDADHYTTEFENDKVRLVRIKYGPGEESVMHYHPDSVAVFLTPHHVQFQAEDGSTVESRLEAGQHIFDPAGNHLPKNLGEEPLELVLVELK